MATYSITKRQDKYPFNQRECFGEHRVVRQIYDGVSATKLKGSAVAVADVFEMVTIPSGAFVKNVAAKVLTVEGGTCTVDIGDGATADGYHAALNGNTSADAVSANGTTTPTFGVGKYYAAADTIDLKVKSGTAAALVIEVSVEYVLMH
jgi:hypothetical protein